MDREKEAGKKWNQQKKIETNKYEIHEKIIKRKFRKVKMNRNVEDNNEKFKDNYQIGNNIE